MAEKAEKDMSKSSYKGPEGASKVTPKSESSTAETQTTTSSTETKKSGNGSKIVIGVVVAVVVGLCLICSVLFGLFLLIPDESVDPKDGGADTGDTLDPENLPEIATLPDDYATSVGGNNTYRYVSGYDQGEFLFGLIYFYPVTWSLDEDTLDTGRFYYTVAPVEGDDQFPDNFVAYVTEIGDEPDAVELELFVSDILDGLDAPSEDSFLSDIDSETIEFKGVDAYRITTEFTYTEQDVVITAEHIVFVINGYGYDLIFTADKDQFDDYADVREQMYDSFYVDTQGDFLAKLY